MTKRQNSRMFLPPRTKENSETQWFFWLYHERVLWETKKISDNVSSWAIRTRRKINFNSLSGNCYEKYYKRFHQENTEINQIVKSSVHCLQFVTKNLLKKIKRFVSLQDLKLINIYRCDGKYGFILERFYCYWTVLTSVVSYIVLTRIVEHWYLCSQFLHLLLPLTSWKMFYIFIRSR